MRDPLLQIAIMMVVEAGLDLRRKVTYKTTRQDKQSAIEFLQSDFARDVLELYGLSPDKFIKARDHQPRLFD